jgi:UDP-2,4-diacetamido-2,4,6-trideoxy-beta-L-altropyranose hydrolase
LANILFRADGSPNIGMGHIIRCLSLANEFRKQGCKVKFISRYSEGIEKIKECKFDVIELNLEDVKSSYCQSLEKNDGNKDHLSMEGVIISNIADIEKPDLLIVDSYNVTYDYLNNLKQKIRRLAYIDDINAFDYPVDVLINGNITGAFLNYNRHNDEELMLLGIEYNLIGEEFKNLNKRALRSKVKNIMITTGGADKYNFTAKLLEMLIENEINKNMTLKVIIGPSFTNKDELYELAMSQSNIILYENVKRMSEIMQDSDIAISSGGSTLYELCACGTPTLSFILADNQYDLVKKLDELGYVINLGWYNEIHQQDLIHQLNTLCNNYEQRSAISNHMQLLVDGNGTRRIVEQILNYCL